MFPVFRHSSLSYTITLSFALAGLFAAFLIILISHTTAQETIASYSLSSLVRSSEEFTWSVQTHLSNESKLKSLYQNDRFDKGIHRYLVSEKGKVVVSRVLDNSGSLDLLQNDFRGPVFLHPSCYVSCVAKDIFDKWGPLVSIDQEIEFLSEVFGRKVAVSIKPIPDPENGHKFWSVSVLPLSYYQSLLKSGAQLSLLASVGLVFIMIAWGRWFSGHLTKPLRELNRSAEQIGQGDWEREISIVGDDEIGQLAGSLKKMAF